MSVSERRSYEIPLSEPMLREMVVWGAAEKLEDGSYRITEKFQTYLQEWCALRIPPNMRKE